VRVSLRVPGRFVNDAIVQLRHLRLRIENPGLGDFTI
jgi:hypothetical protein